MIGHPERSLADFSAKRSRRTCICSSTNFRLTTREPSKRDPSPVLPSHLLMKFSQCCSCQERSKLSVPTHRKAAPFSKAENSRSRKISIFSELLISGALPINPSMGSLRVCGGIVGLSTLMISALLHPSATSDSQMTDLSTARLAASPSTSVQDTSSSRALGDDYYTPSRSDRHDNSSSSASAMSGQNQISAANSTDTQMSALLSAISSILGGSGLSGSSSQTNSPIQSGSGSQTDSPLQSGSSSQANSPLATALQTAEQDGAQVAQWMSEQAEMGGSSQATSPAAASLMSNGAALVSQFSDDLSQVGDVIGQAVSSVASDLEAQGFSSSQVGFVSGVLTSALDSAALGTIGSSINAEAGSGAGAGEGISFGFSDSALSPGQGSAASPSQLSMYIAGSNAPGSSDDGTSGSTGNYGFALQFDSTNSTAVVGGGSVVANSDGSTTTTEAVAASDVEQYTMYTASDLQTGSGQSSLTTAVMNGAISNTIGLGISETTDGSATSQSAVAIDAYSETMNLSMANTSIPTNANGSTNAAPAYSYVA
jgi:hypothetical protein